MKKAAPGLVFLGCLFWLIGCESAVDVFGGQTCTPGESISCSGNNGCSGFQECAADGKSYGTCQCGAGGNGSAGNGTGGNATGGTGSGNNGPGGASTGGTGAGAGGSGGAGGTPNPDCPVSEPQDNSDCTSAPAGTSCPYDDKQCLCFWDEWDCDECPATEPSDGDSCQNAGMGSMKNCIYGNTQCVCRQQQWNCDQCPPDAPQEYDSCQQGGLLCTWGDTECACFYGYWYCSGWPW